MNLEDDFFVGEDEIRRIEALDLGFLDDYEVVEVEEEEYVLDRFRVCVVTEDGKFASETCYGSLEANPLAKVLSKRLEAPFVQRSNDLWNHGTDNYEEATDVEVIGKFEIPEGES